MANLKDLLVNGVTRFIGKVYAPTPEAGDNSTQVATTAFVMENAGASGYHPTLFDFKYSDKLLNDIQWLRSDTFSWQDGTTYSSAYNELLSEYNNSASTTVTEGSITFKRTPKGYKIALATQETAILNKYNSNGIAWYYILDTTNTRFKLPRTKFGFEGLRTNVGDDIEAGLPDHKHRVAGDQGEGGSYLTAYPDNAIKYTGITGGSDYKYTLFAYTIGDEPTLGVTGSASVINSIYGNSDTVQPPATQMYLYFYVGEYTESAEAQTAGLNSELFNGKADLNFNNMNPSQTAKNTIVGWGMPDYSAQIICGSVVNTTLTYECPSKGWVSPDFISYDGAGYFAINGINIQYRTTGTQYMVSHVGLYPVEAGDVVTARSTYPSAGYLSMNVYFYPCKGAN